MTAKAFLEVSKGVRSELDELLETHAEIEQALRGGGGAVDGVGEAEEDQALLDELAGLGEDNTVSDSSIIGAAAVGAAAVGAAAVDTVAVGTVTVGSSAVGAAESVAAKAVGETVAKTVGKAVGTTVAVRAVLGQMEGKAEGTAEGKAEGNAAGETEGEAVEKAVKEEGGGKAVVPLLEPSSVAVEVEPAVVASVNGDSEEGAETTEEKDTKNVAGRIVAGKRATQKEKQKEKRVLVAS